MFFFFRGFERTGSMRHEKGVERGKERHFVFFGSMLPGQGVVRGERKETFGFLWEGTERGGKENVYESAGQ